MEQGESEKPEGEKEQATVVRASKTRRVFGAGTKIPPAILNDDRIKAAERLLGDRYNWELAKTVWRIRTTAAKTVALQMPEGLLMFATTLVDVIEELTDAIAVIMGDVTYGACCVDDFAARALGADLLVHYGHSCLVPIDASTGIKVLYVFVDIAVDVDRFVETVKRNLPKEEIPNVGLVSTIQFVASAQRAAAKLNEAGYSIATPQTKPLSPGEILGCTAPSLRCTDALLYLGDGRFHLESAMIANPSARAFRYDPYADELTEEFYDHETMRARRKAAVDEAAGAEVWGLILGTLGRQGSRRVLDALVERVGSRPHAIILLSEIFPRKLDAIEGVSAFAQTSCPRLSIDWGSSFSRPLLTPYEAAVALGKAEWTPDGEKSYPMDYYANASLGPWTPNHKPESVVESKTCCGKCA